jgi:hypothetical protein
MPAWQAEINGLLDAFPNRLLTLACNARQPKLAPECDNGTLAVAYNGVGMHLAVLV